MRALKTPEFVINVDDEQITAQLEFHGDTTLRTIELHEAGSNDTPANLGAWRLADGAHTFEIDMDEEGARAIVDGLSAAGIASFASSRLTQDGCTALATIAVSDAALLPA